MHGFPGEASESAGVFARWSRPRSARYCSVQRVTRLPLPQPCGFEGLVVTLRFLADGPAQGGDGLFGVYCHEHCKLLKMTVSSLQGDGAGRATEHKRGSGCSEPRKSANVRLIMI
mmetsp:Transcript_52537/g.137794  ORF Transcript_52537/g.137794 Transcript_52537/m.137794 type:complete len:115 (+) Transcript_52537:2709-3053(+)